MRLEFNYIVIDDDFNDDDDCKDINSLIEKINQKLREKGFIPNYSKYVSKKAFKNEQDSKSKATTLNRIDLYLSDNNLGNSGDLPDENEHSNDGIEIYIQLKKDFICDFILYTRSDTQEIINKMIQYLNTSRDPGLFTRFNFIARNSNESWHEGILETIDFIITKREEMNNLRGLFAEKIAQIDLHLKQLLQRDNNEKFRVTLENIPQSRFNNSSLTWKKLDNLRQIRNALLHCNEEFNIQSNEYTLTYKEEDNSGKKTNKEKIIYESQCTKYRNWLTSAYEEVMAWK